MTVLGKSLARVGLVLAFTIAPILPAALHAVPPQFRPVPNTDNGYERTLLQQAYLRYLERAHSAAHAAPTCPAGDVAEQQYMTGVGSDNENRTYRNERPACAAHHIPRSHVLHFGSNH